MTAPKLKIRKGDLVIVHTGRDKGKTGKVISVNKSNSRVLVKDVNLYKRHIKQTQENAGGIVTKELPIHISNLAIVDGQSNTGTKVGFKILEDGKKVRYCKKSGQIL